MYDSYQWHLVPILGFLGITMAAFAIVIPFNHAAWDDWRIFWTIAQGEWGYYVMNRPFMYVNAMIADFVMPHQAQGIQITHMLSYWITGMSLFYISRRLLRSYTWFAFLFAAVYILYIPFNVDQINSMWLIGYGPSLAISAVAALSFVSYTLSQAKYRFLLLLVGCFLAYFAIRVVESNFTILAFVPVVMFLHFLIRAGKFRKPEGAFLLATSLWYVVIGFAFLEFFISYQQGSVDTTYQRIRFPPVENLDELADNYAIFLRQSFPFESMALLRFSDYVLPSLPIVGLVGLVVAYFWRRFPSERQLPGWRALLMLFVVGFAFILIAAFPYTYANLLEYRSHNFSAPGEALVIMSVFGLLARGIRSIVRVRLETIVAVFIVSYFVLGGSWYYIAQADKLYSLNFSQKNIMFRELKSLVPHLRERTLFVFYCPDAESKHLWVRPADVFGVSLLYEGLGDIRDYTQLEFGDERVTTNDAAAYSYEDIIVLGCRGEGLHIMNTVPEALIDPGIAAGYNPVANIREGFIPDNQAKLMAR